MCICRYNDKQQQDPPYDGEKKTPNDEKMTKNLVVNDELPSWRMLWVDFVNLTSWHGVRFLEMRSRFIIRKSELFCFVKIISHKSLQNCVLNLKYLFLSRIVWFCLLIFNLTLFFYIVITKLWFMATLPTTISIKVVHNETVPFSAVTLCNPNLYRFPCTPYHLPLTTTNHHRLTAVQKHGLYDVMVNDKNGEDEDCECE